MKDPGQKRAVHASSNRETPEKRLAFRVSRRFTRIRDTRPFLDQMEFRAGKVSRLGTIVFHDRDFLLFRLTFSDSINSCATFRKLLCHRPKFRFYFGSFNPLLARN